MLVTLLSVKGLTTAMPENAKIEQLTRELLNQLDPEPNRQGLLETPARVAKAWRYWTSGYGIDPKDVLKTFKDGAERYDEMVIVNNIPFTSTCEHHLAPFIGHAAVAYIPDGQVVGLSKLARLLEVFAKRLQVQERITQQVTTALMEHLSPKGAGCIISAEHTCMSSRGVKIHDSHTVTSSLQGVFREMEVRQEFFSLARYEGK